MYYLAKFAILLLLVSGCAPKPSADVKVAVLLKSSTNPFFALMWEGIKSEADRSGIGVELFWPEKEEQFSFQSNFLDNKAQEYNALIVAPANPVEIKPFLKKLKENGQKVIVLDEDLPLSPKEAYSDYYNSFIATDNVMGGKLAAEYSKNTLKPNDSVIVLAGFDFEKARTDAFEKRISEQVPNIKIHRFLGHFDRARSKLITRRHKKLFLESKVIYCANDHMALGVIEELKRGSKSALPIVIGYDSIRAAHESILKGDLSASVVQFPAKMGQEGVRTLVQLINGNAVANRILIPPQLSVLRPSVQTISLEYFSSPHKARVHENF